MYNMLVVFIYCNVIAAVAVISTLSHYRIIFFSGWNN